MTTTLIPTLKYQSQSVSKLYFIAAMGLFAAEARRAVAATKYAPQGVRGMAGMSRGSRFGTVKDYFKVANDAVRDETIQIP